MSANQTDLFAAIEQEQKDKDSLASSEQLDAFAPLASRLRPQSVDEYIGQRQLIAKGRPLRAL